MNNPNSIFEKAKKEMIDLNKKYEDISKHNKEKSSQIRKSIESKSTYFNSKKLRANKHFDIIRNK
jgi:Na+/phosphate symporter